MHFNGKKPDIDQFGKSSITKKDYQQHTDKSQDVGFHICTYEALNYPCPIMSDGKPAMDYRVSLLRKDPGEYPKYFLKAEEKFG